MTEWLYCSLCSLCSLAGWIFSICLYHSFGGGLSVAILAHVEELGLTWLDHQACVCAVNCSPLGCG